MTACSYHRVRPKPPVCAVTLAYADAAIQVMDAASHPHLVGVVDGVVFWGIVRGRDNRDGKTVVFFSPHSCI